ncbi:hypothetical protein M2D07_013365 [Pseudomonas sp. BGr12]|uniref:Uncharacterized protein n=1 Tax=Pseudomonas nitroreducens TaxID=46680 RepID=A0A5R9AK28_PSENT|nr:MULTISPECIES: hypothetical protein [Pseudomonas]MBD9499898.1 hypothetical protein [Pseudomonas sp. PDM17]MBD9575361.1 hypothetical protein [Pseudomonas sp. PDM23]MBD9669697.1 hypothetical protein [Pseudomonas sp. PDM21]MDL2428004.1 hypothetical protein [Pseudomonas sp. BJa5]TLP78504.1 hypothetical protein FEA48_04695 [Pseudomonas nitroreducens]
MALLLVFLYFDALWSPIYWLFSLIKRFTPVTSELRTTFRKPQKNFSQGLFGKNLMSRVKSSTLFLRASPRVSWVWAGAGACRRSQVRFVAVRAGTTAEGQESRGQHDKKLSLAF